MDIIGYLNNQAITWNPGKKFEALYRITLQQLAEDKSLELGESK